MTFLFDKLATVSGHALSATDTVLSAAWAALVDANKTDAVDQALEIAGDALYLADIAGDTLDLVDDVTKLFSLVGIGIGLLFALSRWVLPSWRILRRCLFYGQPFSRLRAAGEVFLCFYYLWWETRDLYRAARLRVEAELLQPRPEQPFPSFESKEDWHSAIKEYRKKNNEWRYNLKRLLANLADQSSSGKSPVVCLGRWFDLAEDTTVTRIKRYFQVLASERSPQATSVDSFLTSIQITSGFIAPIHLVAGLLLRFQDDWGRVIDAYGYAASRDRDPLQRRSQVLKLRKFQTFLFDCWLLWGPSIPICTCEYWRGVIAMQYGFGDENNSFPLIDTAGTLTERYRKLLAPYEEPRPVAVPASIDVRIRSGSALAASAPIAHAQRNIKDTLVLELTELHEVSGDQIRIAGTYYSAYIWVMFVVQRSDGQPLFPEQKWRGLLPFFEHGNIADGSIYNFLKRQLARKTLAAIEQILGQEADLKLGYVSAFDEPASCGKDLRFPLSGLRIREIMEELLANEFPHLQSLGRLSLAKGTDPEYSACHLPDIIEAFYADLENYPKAPPRKTMYKYAELSSVPEDRALLQQFYHGLYKGEFPDPNERESLSNI